MIANYLVTRLVEMDPGRILAWILAISFLTGLAGSLAVPAFITLMDKTKKAQARYRAAIPAEARARIGLLSSRLVEAQDENRKLRADNEELRRLLRTETNFGRNHRAEAMPVLARKPS